MALIQDLMPVNLDEEKEGFFKSNFKYNPQFKYGREFDVETLTKYGFPKKEYLIKAKSDFEKYDFKAKEQRNLGKKLTQEEVAGVVDDLFRELRIPPLKIVYSRLQAARCLVALQKGELIFRRPLNLTADDLRQLLYHEVQTHYLRWLNDQQQPWHLEKRSALIWKKTEEGLATYNSMRIGGEKIKAAVALKYVAIDLAKTASFAEVFAYLNNYLKNDERSWKGTVRLKRGLKDTSLGGGFTRDLVYYEGLCEVSNWLENGGNIKDLYWGKISWQEVEDLRKLAKVDNLVYPTFV